MALDVPQYSIVRKYRNFRKLCSMGFYPRAWSRFWEIFSSTTMTGFLKLSSKKISSFGNWEQISVEFQYCQICALAKNRQILPEIAKMALFAKNYWISLNVSMILQIVILWYNVVKPIMHAGLRPNLGFGIFFHNYRILRSPNLFGDLKTD